MTNDLEKNSHFTFAGWGTNEALIISVLAHRNAAQRKAIRQTYAQTYEEDLLKALDKELTNDFEVGSYVCTHSHPCSLYSNERKFSEVPTMISMA